jgi:hypothetical protein
MSTLRDVEYSNPLIYFDPNDFKKLAGKVLLITGGCSGK